MKTIYQLKCCSGQILFFFFPRLDSCSLALHAAAHNTGADTTLLIRSHWLMMQTNDEPMTGRKTHVCVAEPISSSSNYMMIIFLAPEFVIT